MCLLSSRLRVSSSTKEAAAAKLRAQRLSDGRLSAVGNEAGAADSETPQTFKLDDGVTTLPYLVMGNPSFAEVRVSGMDPGGYVWDRFPVLSPWSLLLAVLGFRADRHATCGCITALGVLRCSDRRRSTWSFCTTCSTPTSRRKF